MDKLWLLLILWERREIGMMNLSACWRILDTGWGELSGSGGGARSWSTRGCCVVVNEGGTIPRVRKLGNCLRCWNGCGAKTENARFDTEISRRIAFAGFPLEWIEVAFGFRGQIPLLEEGSGRVGAVLRGRKTESDGGLCSMSDEVTWLC